MPFLKVYVHFTWSTKNKISSLAIKEVRKIIWNHITTSANKNGIRVDFINGYANYYHCLIDLEADLTIQEVIATLKAKRLSRFVKKRFQPNQVPLNCLHFQTLQKVKNLNGTMIILPLLSANRFLTE